MAQLTSDLTPAAILMEASTRWRCNLTAGFSQPVGEVDLSRLNVMGGSIAIGHPFGATGSRITVTLLNELARRDGQFGLMTVCTAGGMGFSMVVERDA